MSNKIEFICNTSMFDRNGPIKARLELVKTNDGVTLSIHAGQMISFCKMSLEQSKELVIFLQHSN